MTCIVGLITDEFIIFGSDTLGTANNVAESYATPKVFRIETKNKIPMLIGFCGSFRLGDVLRYEISLPKISKKHTKRDLVRKLMPMIRECYEEYEDENKGEFLIGIHNKIFIVQNDYSVLQPKNYYTALGGGIEYALGSMFSTEGLEPCERVERAIEAAKTFSPSVGGDTVLVKLKLNK